MDVRASAIAACRLLGVEAYATPPAERPGEFATVVQGAGRAKSRVACTTVVTVTAWAASEARAAALAGTLRDGLCMGFDGALDVSVNANTHPDNDPESGTPRASVALTVCHRI